MRIKTAIRNFFTGYFATCNRSPKTRAAYSLDLRQFQEFLAKNIDLRSVTPELVEGWVLQLQENGYQPASIQRKIAVLRTFFNYWVRRRNLKYSPLWHLRIDFGKRRTLTKVMSENEISSLIKQAKKSERSSPDPSAGKITGAFLSLRNRAIIELLFATGIRVGELGALTLSDISLAEHSINISGKGNRQRLAFLVDPHTLATIKRYISYRTKLTTHTNALFINTFRTALSTQGVANILSRLAQDAHLTKHITPHMVRHTAATLLLRNGADLKIVQEFLGHASIISTQRYLHITKDHLIDSLKKYHPNNSIYN